MRWAWPRNAGTRLRLLHGEQDLSDNMQCKQQAANARPAWAMSAGDNAQSRHQAVTAPRWAEPERQYAMEAAGCDCTSGSKEHTCQGARSAGNNARHRLPQGHQAATAPRRAESERKYAMQGGRLWLHARQPRTNWPRSAGDTAQCRLPAECECTSGSKAYLPRSEERKGQCTKQAACRRNRLPQGRGVQGRYCTMHAAPRMAWPHNEGTRQLRHVSAARKQKQGVTMRKAGTRVRLLHAGQDLGEQEKWWRQTPAALTVCRKAQCRHQAAVGPRWAGPVRWWALQVAGSDCSPGEKGGALLTPAWDRSAKRRTWAAKCNASGKLRLLVLKNILTKERGMHGGYRVAGNAAEARWQSAHGWLGECPCEHVVHPMRNVEQTPNEVTWSGQAGHTTWLGNEEPNQRPLRPR